MKSVSFFFGILIAAVLIYATATLFVPAPVQADLIPACSASGACGVCDIVGVFITLGKWLIAGGAGLALLVIVNAGVTMVTSAGNPEKVGAGKKQILGATIGLGAVLLAFQFVSFLIFFVVTPSRLQTFEAAQPGTQAGKEQGDVASLKNFLGIPWWTICSQEELMAKSGAGAPPSTANCQYWGNDTYCSNDKKKICCWGKCEQKNPARVGPDGKETKSDCPLFFEVSAPKGQRAQTGATGTGQTGAGGPAVCNIGYDANEQQARNRIAAIGGIPINNGGTLDGQFCGTASFKTYSNNCSGGCTNVGGLQDKVFGYIKTIKDKCGNFTLTGGSEAGHSATGGHSDGLAIDLQPSDANYSLFGNCLKRGIDDKSLSFIRAICASSTDAVFRYECSINEAIRHFHLSFR